MASHVIKCEVTDWLERVVLVLSTNHDVGNKTIPQLMLSLTSASCFFDSITAGTVERYSVRPGLNVAFYMRRNELPN